MAQRVIHSLASTDNMQPLDLTPEGLAKGLLEISDDVLATLPHALLYQAREYAPPELQNRLSKFEHRAFAREVIPENPLMALSLPLAIPGYQAYKTVAGKSRSQPSIEQALQGLVGVGEGVKALIAGIK